MFLNTGSGVCICYFLLFTARVLFFSFQLCELGKWYNNASIFQITNHGWKAKNKVTFIIIYVYVNILHVHINDSKGTEFYFLIKIDFFVCSNRQSKSVITKQSAILWGQRMIPGNAEYPKEQGSWVQHGAHLGPRGPRWGPMLAPWTLLSGIREGWHSHFSLQARRNIFHQHDSSQIDSCIISSSMKFPLSASEMRLHAERCMKHNTFKGCHYGCLNSASHLWLMFNLGVWD